MKILSNFFFIFSLSFISCQKDASLWKVQNLNSNNKIFAFGHGGSGTMYRFPMNSMESLKHVLSIGADGTEMDLQLTKDNQLVLFHNNNLQDATNGKGAVRENNWEDIKNVEYTFPIFNKTKLIRVVDFFDEIVADNNHIFTFDCKVEANDDRDYLENFVNELYKIIVTYHLENNCFIESYNLTFLKGLAAKDEKLKLFVHSNNLADGLSIAHQVKLYGITIDRLKITKEEIETAHQNNLHITLYNMVSHQQNIKAIQMNPDFLQSDKNEELIKVFKK